MPPVEFQARGDRSEGYKGYVNCLNLQRTLLIKLYPSDSKIDHLNSSHQFRMPPVEFQARGDRSGGYEGYATDKIFKNPLTIYQIVTSDSKITCTPHLINQITSFKHFEVPS
jgi:hypothetical protein